MSEPFHFRMEITAAPDEIDELGHVSNVVYVRWILDVAMGHSRAVGWDHPEYRKLGAVFVVRRHDVEYQAPCYAGERILLETWVDSWTAASSDRRTRIVRVADGKELARATTLWVFVTLDRGRPTRIPPALLDEFLRPPTAE